MRGNWHNTILTMSYKEGYIVYNHNHNINVTYDKTAVPVERLVSIKITEILSQLVIKLRDVNDYSFNYMDSIDYNKFENIKQEQSLDIEFEDFKAQLLELLKKTLSKEMLIRIDASDSKSKLIFYEKSKLKSLIFLVLELNVTDQKDILSEMTETITDLKNENQILSGHLISVKKRLSDKDAEFRTAINTNAAIKTEFLQHLQAIANLMETKVFHLEKKVAERVAHLQKKLLHIASELNIVKRETQLKSESSARLAHCLQNLRLETENNVKTINDLKAELEKVNKIRHKVEQNAYDFKTELTRKESDVDSLQKELNELKRDMQDATMIIAQKTRANDEIAKDLLQANQMLVTFNNQYDAKAKEVEEREEQIRQREEMINNQQSAIKRISDEFEQYKSEFSAEEFGKLKNELYVAKRKIEELDKVNRETIKLNGVLTKKLSSGEVFEMGKWGPPSRP